MLEELRNYNNLGTPCYFFELFNQLIRNSKSTFTKSDILSLFHNRIIDGRSEFAGCLELMLKINVLVEINSGVFLNEKILKSLSNISHMSAAFVELLFRGLMNAPEIHDIFSTKYLSYDIHNKAFTIGNSAFRLKYSNFKQLLIDFEIIKNHPTIELNCYIINNQFRYLIDDIVLQTTRTRKIGVNSLKESLEQQIINGELAEKFVMDFELERLNDKREIDWVSLYVVNAGYDIASYDNVEDESINRFIEVKSYFGNTPYFYWSRNEFTAARNKGDSYWLYLVNRAEIPKNGYQPLMIRNPYSNILKCKNWHKTTENIRVEYIH